MPTATIPAPGDVIAGRYRVERLLGAGGMGVVLAAKHLQLGHQVAIKFVRQEFAADGQVVSRFLREAHAAVALSSEHATRVFDAGLLEGGEPYMVMEYLDGVDLDQVLRREGPMAVSRAVDFVLQACEAIAEAHARGIVHRDLKPSNLFLARRFDGSPLVKVLDFGVSKLLTPSSVAPGDLTSTGTIMGSPHYMSPEQMVSTKEVDAQTDVWALGVILYQFLTARVPFPGETIAEIAIRAATQEPPFLRPVRPDVPEPLEAAILRCLRRDRGARWATVTELARALAEFAPPAARAIVERLRVTPELAAPSQAPAVVETILAPAMTPSLVAAAASGGLGATGTMSPVGGTGPGVVRRKAGVGVLALVVACVAAAAGTLAVGLARRARDLPVGAETTIVGGPGLDARTAAAPSASAPADAPPEAPRADTASPAAPMASIAPSASPAPVPNAAPSASVRRPPPGVSGDSPPRARTRPAGAAPVYNPLDHL